jgi:hypothetical protein
MDWGAVMHGSGETIAQTRKRRPAPQAAGPARGPAGTRKGGDNGAAPAGGSVGDPEPLNGAGAAAGPESGVIAASVRAAYSLVERNMQEGRNAAERLRAAGVSQAEPPNAREVANRMLHLSRDLGATWIDLIGTLLREPDVRSMIERLSTGDRAQRTPSVAAITVTQRLSSRRPVEVTLSPLQLSDATRLPGIAGLYSVAAGTPPITSVHFAARAGGLELNLAIADDQPAGAYAGTVVDADSQAPIGTLAVRILE